MKSIVDTKSESSIIMTRVFDAPREAGWAVLTDPKHVRVWYGGHGFENPVCEMDVRPGGRWRHVMRTPDGSEHPSEFVFVDVIRPEKLSWRDASPRPGVHPSPLVVVTLEEAGAKQTRWTMVARFETAADRAGAMQFGFTTVLDQGCDKLEAILRAAAT